MLLLLLAATTTTTTATIATTNTATSRTAEGHDCSKPLELFVSQENHICKTTAETQNKTSIDSLTTITKSFL